MNSPCTCGIVTTVKPWLPAGWPCSIRADRTGARLHRPLPGTVGSPAYRPAPPQLLGRDPVHAGRAGHAHPARRAPLACVADTPTEWISLLIGLAIFIVSSAQALVEVGFVLLRVVPGFIPSFLWMLPASAIAGLGLLWVVSIWRLSRNAAQGV